MIRMAQAEWNGREWHCAFSVNEGVYRRDRYPVIVGYLGHTDDSNVCAGFAQVVTGLVHAHLKKGSLPPGGLLINWRREYEHWISPTPPTELDPTIIALGLWVSQQISPIAQGEGHGYYQPLIPVGGCGY